MNEAVRNNPDKLPPDYLLELDADESRSLRTKISTLKPKGANRGAHSKQARREEYPAESLRRFPSRTRSLKGCYHRSVQVVRSTKSPPAAAPRAGARRDPVPPPERQGRTLRASRRAAHRKCRLPGDIFPGALWQSIPRSAEMTRHAGRSCPVPPRRGGPECRDDGGSLPLTGFHPTPKSILDSMISASYKVD